MASFKVCNTKQKDVEKNSFFWSKRKGNANDYPEIWLCSFVFVKSSQLPDLYKGSWEIIILHYLEHVTTK